VYYDVVKRIFYLFIVYDDRASIPVIESKDIKKKNVKVAARLNKKEKQQKLKAKLDKIAEFKSFDERMRAVKSPKLPQARSLFNPCVIAPPTFQL